MQEHKPFIFEVPLYILTSLLNSATSDQLHSLFNLGQNNFMNLPTSQCFIGTAVTSCHPLPSLFLQ